MTQETQQTSQGKTQREKGVKLALEIGTRMAVTFDGMQQTPDSRIASDLVGMIHFEYVILRLPWVPGLRSRLVAGASATVRFVSHGDLCGFQSPILTHIPKPSLLLFLQYPDVVEKMTLRQHRRVQCALPVQITSPRGETNGVIADLSQGGCRMVVDVYGLQELRQTVAEDVIILHVPLNAESSALAVTCTVRNVSFTANRMELGLSFTEADTPFWESLENFLSASVLLM